METYAGTLTDFVKEFDLFDRRVEYIDVGEEAVIVTLEMYHCDDPVRDDENTDYTLILVFDRLPGQKGTIDEPPPADTIGGKILDYRIVDGILLIGIDWRLRGNPGSTWRSLQLPGPPSRMKEIVTRRDR